MILKAPSSSPSPPGSHFSRSPSLDRRCSSTESSSKSSSSSQPPRQPKSSSSSKPPCQPKPWSWRCSRCRTIYRLGATTRCLHCGHRIGRPHNISRGRVRKTVACKFYFDYSGWRDYMDWSRLVREVPPEKPQQLEEGNRDDTDDDASDGDASKTENIDKDVELGSHDGRDCFWGCDYPSQCIFDAIEY